MIFQRGRSTTNQGYSPLLGMIYRDSPDSRCGSHPSHHNVSQELIPRYHLKKPGSEWDIRATCAGKICSWDMMSSKGLPT